MPPKPIEGKAQPQFALELRFAIDTARKYPTTRNREEALALARSQPRALASTHVRHNLGASRWEWLASHGVYPIGEPTEIAGQPAIKGTITPEVTK